MFCTLNGTRECFKISYLTRVFLVNSLANVPSTEVRVIRSITFNNRHRYDGTRLHHENRDNQTRVSVSLKRKGKILNIGGLSAVFHFGFATCKKVSYIYLYIYIRTRCSSDVFNRPGQSFLKAFRATKPSARLSRRERTEINAGSPPLCTDAILDFYKLVRLGPTDNARRGSKHYNTRTYPNRATSKIEFVISTNVSGSSIRLPYVDAVTEYDTTDELGSVKLNRVALKQKKKKHQRKYRK